MKPSNLISRYKQSFTIITFFTSPRPQKENNAPAPKKTENEAERMEMSAVGDEMEVELSADTLDYVIFNSRLLRLAMWSTLTPRMLATPSWSVLVLAYIFFHPR